MTDLGAHRDDFQHSDEAQLGEGRGPERRPQEYRRAACGHQGLCRPGALTTRAAPAPSRCTARALGLPQALPPDGRVLDLAVRAKKVGQRSRAV